MITTELFVKMAIDRWNGSIINLNKHLNNLTDEQLQKEIAPGKNRGTYLLGHLIAVHDNMLILMGMGEKIFPELFELYINQSDDVAIQTLTASELKSMWGKHNELLQEKFAKMKAEEWFEKNTSATVEEFALEPHRNKLNIIITRTSHLQYHTGQIALLK